MTIQEIIQKKESGKYKWRKALFEFLIKYKNEYTYEDISKICLREYGLIIKPRDVKDIFYTFRKMYNENIPISSIEQAVKSKQFVSPETSKNFDTNSTPNESRAGRRDYKEVVEQKSVTYTVKKNNHS